eukprot:5490215-Amphidinium_carterae.1
MGTSPKRLPKKAATPRDDNCVDDPAELASKRARSDVDGPSGSVNTSSLSDSAKIDRILQLAEHHS